MVCKYYAENLYVLIYGKNGSLKIKYTFCHIIIQIDFL